MSNLHLRIELIDNIGVHQKDIREVREALSAALDLLADQDRRLTALRTSHEALRDQERTNQETLHRRRRALLPRR